MTKISKCGASNEIRSILDGLCSERLFTMNKGSDSKYVFQYPTLKISLYFIFFYILHLLPNERKYSGGERRMLKIG